MEGVSDKDRGGIKSERCLSDPLLSHEVGTSTNSSDDAALSHEVGTSTNSSDDAALSHEVGTSTNSSDDAALSHEVGTSTNSSDVVESRQILSEQSMNMRPSTSEGPEGPTTHLSVPTLLPHPPVASSTDTVEPLLTTTSDKRPLLL